MPALRSRDFEQFIHCILPDLQQHVGRSDPAQLCCCCRLVCQRKNLGQLQPPPLYLKIQRLPAPVASLSATLLARYHRAAKKSPAATPRRQKHKDPSPAAVPCSQHEASLPPGRQPELAGPGKLARPRPRPVGQCCCQLFCRAHARASLRIGFHRRLPAATPALFSLPRARRRYHNTYGRDRYLFSNRNRPDRPTLQHHCTSAMRYPRLRCVRPSFCAF